MELEQSDFQNLIRLFEHFPNPKSHRENKLSVPHHVLEGVKAHENDNQSPVNTRAGLSDRRKPKA